VVLGVISTSSITEHQLDHRTSTRTTGCRGTTSLVTLDGLDKWFLSLSKGSTNNSDRFMTAVTGLPVRF
jgi:hypothetical protein